MALLRILVVERRFVVEEWLVGERVAVLGPLADVGSVVVILVAVDATRPVRPTLQSAYVDVIIRGGGIAS